MSTLSQFVGGGIKSIQRGTISITTGGGGSISTGTYTLSPAATDLTKCRIKNLGMTTNTPTTEGSARIELTNTTTVTAYVYSYGVVSSVVVGFEFEESY